jgi:hypothetical protein
MKLADHRLKVFIRLLFPLVDLEEDLMRFHRHNTIDYNDAIEQTM